MKKQDKHKAPAEPPSKGMSLDAIMEQLSDLKDIATSLQTPMDGDRVAACEAATDILNALQDEGIKDPEQVRDLIHDYNALAEQYRKMHQRYEEPAQVLRLGGGAGPLAFARSATTRAAPATPTVGIAASGWAGGGDTV